MQSDFQIFDVMGSIKNCHVTKMELAYIWQYFLVLN